MSLNRRAARRDTVEPEIVDTLLACGFSVRRLSAKGVPDLLIGKHGTTRIVECKTDDGALTPDQVEFWAGWNGNGPIILRSADDVQRLARLWPTLDGGVISRFFGVNR